MEAKAKILVVDDEEDICEILQYNLEKAGYKVETVLSAEDALAVIPTGGFDLIMLDIMLGGISGLKLAQLLRNDYKNSVPIIFISALDTEIDILKGFKTGGDDYISKPFKINEAIARVGAVITRYKNSFKENREGISPWQNGSTPPPRAQEVENSKLQFGPLTILTKEKKVFVNDTEVFLTKKEMDILLLLSEKTGTLFSRGEILQNVWKTEAYVLERTVDVHMARLRKKLGVAGEFIINRSGYGYYLQKPESK